MFVRVIDGEIGAALLAPVIAGYKDLGTVHNFLIANKGSATTKAGIVGANDYLGDAVLFCEFGHLAIESDSAAMYPYRLGVCIPQFCEKCGACIGVAVSSECYLHDAGIVSRFDDLTV